MIMRTHKFFWIVSLFIVTLYSCSTDSTNQAKQLKSFVEVSNDGSTSETVLNYSGSNLASMTSEDKVVTFTYTGQLVTRIVEENSLTQSIVTRDYTYSNGKLVKIVSSDLYETRYSYLESGAVVYQKVHKDSNGNEINVYHGTLYFANTNLIKDERILDDAGVNVLSKETVTYQYDSKINPVHELTGFDKLLDYSTTTSVNNCISFYKETSIHYLDSDQILSSAVGYDNSIRYDEAGYPIENVTSLPLFGTLADNHEKTEFFYN
jgi:hypothetical protein